MVWPWSLSKPVKETSKENNSSEIEFRDPSLTEFYTKAKPPTPVSLAPETVQHDQTSSSDVKDTNAGISTIPGFASNAETVSTTYSHLGAGSFELKGGGRKISLQQAARDNCVEFEVALSNCIVRGSIFDRFLSCRTQQMNQQKCTELQEYALAVLGYNLALSQDERNKIQGLADDLLIAHAPDSRLTEDICEQFKTAVDNHRSSTVKYRS
ncbi:hypothetical protein AWJ20_1624 [Sugiyamaella lignohabitans]|uniref:Uncharacterized protein n=1 Tax=Sugiyamaella lignohabitans TaxID=796027 RepID=A0A167DVC3_9ASCO|nr:uncharacterized protein AWJ20_1624 [Sugiyamaella lignohabitans]ANB13338.1 hypothetical protein AWJ20_1624 [Sugiyamaella lignohabitans]